MKGTAREGGEKAISEQFVRGEDGTLLRDKMRIRAIWAEFCCKSLNTRSLTLDPTIIELYSTNRRLHCRSEMYPLLVVTKVMLNWKVAWPDSLPAELLKHDHREFVRCFHSIRVNAWKTGDVPQQ